MDRDVNATKFAGGPLHSGRYLLLFCHVNGEYLDADVGVLLANLCLNGLEVGDADIRQREAFYAVLSIDMGYGLSDALTLLAFCFIRGC